MSDAYTTLAGSRIRFAQYGDDAALGRLDHDNWSTMHAVKPRDEPPLPPFFTDRFGPRDHIVAELADRVVGYVRLGMATPLASNGHVRQIHGFVVAGETRGRGVGRALIRAAVEETRRQGALRITLRVLGHNAPARGLYASEGFLVEGIQPGEFFLGGEYVDDVLMGRSV